MKDSLLAEIPWHGPSPSLRGETFAAAAAAAAGQQQLDASKYTCWPRIKSCKLIEPSLILTLETCLTSTKVRNSTRTLGARLVKNSLQLTHSQAIFQSFLYACVAWMACRQSSVVVVRSKTAKQEHGVGWMKVSPACDVRSRRCCIFSVYQKLHCNVLNSGDEMILLL